MQWDLIILIRISSFICLITPFVFFHSCAYSQAYVMISFPSFPFSRHMFHIHVVMLPLLRHLPNPHFSFLALFPPYHLILTTDYLMVPPFPDPLITMWSLCLTPASCATIFSSSSYLLCLLLILPCVHY